MKPNMSNTPDAIPIQLRTIKERVRQNTIELARSLKKMPKCQCGHPRIKHGVYCDQSCIDGDCDCYGYVAREALKQEGNDVHTR